MGKTYYCISSFFLCLNERALYMRIRAVRVLSVICAFMLAVTAVAGAADGCYSGQNLRRIRKVESGDVDAINTILGNDARTATISTNPRLTVINGFLDDESVVFRGYDGNVHTEYAGAEKAILEEEKELRRRYETKSDDMLAALAKNDLEQAEKIGGAMRNLLEQLKLVMEAKEKFIRIGIPAYHSHTNHEDDGMASPQELVDHAIDNGLTVLYVTGHDHISGSLEAIKYLRQERTDSILEIRPGAEIDAAVFGETGIVHFVVTAPDDEAAIAELNATARQVFDGMQGNLRWRFERAMELGSGDTFNCVWDELLPDNREQLLELARFLEKEGLLDAASSDTGDLTKLKEALKQWFGDIRDLHESVGAPDEFFNKPDVMGIWTEALEKWPSEGSPRWPGKAAKRVIAMRGFFDLIYTDEEVARESGSAMASIDDITARVVPFGCRVTLAHPAYELFITNEIKEADHERFWEKIGDLVARGMVHAVGSAWPRGQRPIIDNAVRGIREATGKSEEELPIVYNIPDYHGRDYPLDTNESIRKGVLQTETDASGGAKEQYWTWEDILPPDIGSYFRDGEYLAEPALKRAAEHIEQGKHEEALLDLRTAARTHPYSGKLMGLNKKWINSIARASFEPVSYGPGIKNPTALVVFDWTGTLYDNEADRLFPGVVELLEKLRKENIRAAISTYNPSGKVISILDRYGINAGPGELISEVGGKDYPERVSDHKTRCMTGWIERDGISPMAVIKIGDAPQDMKEAGDAHVPGIGLVHPGKNKDEFIAESPVALINGFNGFSDDIADVVIDFLQNRGWLFEKRPITVFTEPLAEKLFTEGAGDLVTFRDMLSGMRSDLTDGAHFTISVEKNWADANPEQYKIIAAWWDAVKEVFKESGVLFTDKIVVTKNAENGFVQIRYSNRGGEISKHSCSLRVNGCLDIGPRFFKMLNMVLAASVIPDMEKWKSQSEFNGLIMFINRQYYDLTGMAGYINMLSNITQETINDKIRIVMIDLPQITREEYDIKKEVLMAVAVLTSV